MWIHNLVVLPFAASNIYSAKEVLTKKIKKKVRAAGDQQIILNDEVCLKGYTGVKPCNNRCTGKSDSSVLTTPTRTLDIWRVC